MQVTHVVLGRAAPLLHVHDFHVQHSPELHLDPAKALHKASGRRAPVSRITAEKSQRASLEPSGGDATESDQKLIDSPSERELAEAGSTAASTGRAGGGRSAAEGGRSP